MRLGHIAASRILDLTEIAGEGNLLLVGNVLIMKNEHGETVHARFDRRDIGARQLLFQVGSRDLADKHRVDLTDRDRHSA